MNSSQQTANNTIDLHRLMMLCRKHIKMLIICVHTGYKMLENTDLKLSVFQHFFILVSY